MKTVPEKMLRRWIESEPTKFGLDWLTHHTEVEGKTTASAWYRWADFLRGGHWRISQDGRRGRHIWYMLGDITFRLYLDPEDEAPSPDTELTACIALGSSLQVMHDRRDPCAAGVDSVDLDRDSRTLTVTVAGAPVRIGVLPEADELGDRASPASLASYLKRSLGRAADAPGFTVVPSGTHTGRFTITQGNTTLEVFVVNEDSRPSPIPPQPNPCDILIALRDHAESLGGRIGVFVNDGDRARFDVTLHDCRFTVSVAWSGDAEQDAKDLAFFRELRRHCKS